MACSAQAAGDSNVRSGPSEGREKADLVPWEPRERSLPLPRPTGRPAAGLRGAAGNMGPSEDRAGMERAWESLGHPEVEQERQELQQEPGCPAPLLRESG